MGTKMLGRGGGRVLLCALVAAVALSSGCATLAKVKASEVAYDVTIATTGALSVPPTVVGTVKLPPGSVDVASLGLAASATFLSTRFNYKSCTFAAIMTPPPGATVGVLFVGAEATCNVHGVPVQEGVQVTLTPAVEGIPAAVVVAAPAPAAAGS